MELKWKEGILIALISGIIGYLLHGYLSLGRLELPPLNGLWVVLGFLVGLLAGLFGGSDILGTILNYFKERSEKRATIRLILSEIELAQNILKQLADAVNIWDSDEGLPEDRLFPNELNFDKKRFSALQSKLILLNEADKIYHYYNELEDIERRYPMLNIHKSISRKGQDINQGVSFSWLVYLDLKEKSGEETNLNEIINLLRHSNKVHDLGKELMIGLKKQIGIKLSEEKELIAKDYLQPKIPDIRKLWYECENLKVQISEDKKKIREYIKDKSREGVPIYSKLDKIFDVSYISQNEWGEVVNRTEGDEICRLVDDFASTGKLTKDEEYKEYVEAIINDKTLYAIFGMVRENKTLLNKKTDEYNKWLEKMKKTGR